MRSLKEYYENLFPFETLTKWLTYNHTSSFNKRELSFEFEGGSVKRYVTFSNSNEWKQRMAGSDESIPKKVDAGAIF